MRGSRDGGGPRPAGPRAFGRGSWVAAALTGVVLCAAACAKREPPSGGPPDLEPPRLIGTFPDSGAAGVERDAVLTLGFSEDMEPRATAEAVAFAPKVLIRKRSWKGSTLTLHLADTLKADQTYTLFIAPSARDQHGNTMVTGASIAFSTAAEFPPGSIAGKVEPRGVARNSIALWCYREAKAPDSTAQDFDAIGLPAAGGDFRIEGLVVPARYRLWAFADLNSNRSFEPDKDVLVAVDTTFDLTRERPRVSDVAIVVVNPRAPGEVRGAVLDSLADSLGVSRVTATSESDSTQRITVDTESGGGFSLELTPGAWVLVGFRDLDRDRVWQRGRERASEPLRLQVAPAGEIKDVRLILRPEP